MLPPGPFFDDAPLSAVAPLELEDDDDEEDDGALDDEDPGPCEPGPVGPSPDDAVEEPSTLHAAKSKETAERSDRPRRMRPG